MSALAEKTRLLQQWAGVPQDGAYGPQTADALLRKAGLIEAPPRRSLSNPEAFFAAVRKITGPLDQVQVETINGLLSAASHWPIGWLAYGLATAWHEARLKPIEEYGKGKGRRYGVPGLHGGQIAYGRGLVQLTWPENYAKADKELELGGSLVANYTRALEPDIAVAIMVRGMQEGWFTGKKLADTLPNEQGTLPQFRASRPIINVMDKADLIAGYAVQFQDAARAGGWA